MKFPQPAAYVPLCRQSPEMATRYYSTVNVMLARIAFILQLRSIDLDVYIDCITGNIKTSDESQDKIVFNTL